MEIEILILQQSTINFVAQIIDVNIKNIIGMEFWKEFLVFRENF